MNKKMLARARALAAQPIATTDKAREITARARELSLPELGSVVGGRAYSTAIG